jgi:hypothetical protein
MPDTSFRIRESSWLARVAAWKLGVSSVAITLGRTIHLHGASRRTLLRDRAWLRHELKHVEQFRQYGFLKFIGLYLAESVRVGYYHNRFEREARAAESYTAYDPVDASEIYGGGYFNPTSRASDPDRRGYFNPSAGGSAIPAGQRHNA